MNGVLSYLALDSGWAGHVRELCVEVVDRCAVADGLYTDDHYVGRRGRGCQRRDLVQNSVLATVHQEIEMR